MSEWPHSVTLPTFAAAPERRRKSISVPTGTTKDTPDLARAVTVLAIVASRATGEGRITIPVHRDRAWRAVTLDITAATSLDDLISRAENLLLGPALASPPPTGVTVAVVGDALVDPAHLVLRMRGDEPSMEGPVEPVGAVQLLAGRLAWLDGAVASGAVDSVDELPTCDPAEAATLADQRTGPPIADLVPVTNLISRAARRSPHAAAVTTPWSTLSYDELQQVTADRYAMLQRSEIRAGDVLGLHLSRSSDLVPTILAIWELGAAFVPITENQPWARVTQMLDDAGATRVITDRGEWRPPGEAVAAVSIDRDIKERRARRRDGTAVSLDATAYVLFTSGSTGRPKGVRVTHRNLAHYLSAVTPVMPRGDRVVMLATTPLTFDPSMLELIWPLTEGHEVVIDPGRDVPVGPVARRRQVTHLNGTPTMASLMMHDRDGTEVLETVRHVLLGGEAVRSEFVRELKRVAKAEVMVCYGPTECTVDTTWGPDDGEVGAGILPIGQPLPGHTVDIVDGNDRSVGAFALGELVVSGDAVAAGYVVQPAGPSPFFERDGQRAYRTGDVVWSDASGVIHFIGRIDSQVKIRGHRIEIGELDGRLIAHPAIRTAASVVIGEADARRLVSFIVEEAPTIDDDLISWVQEALPEPMVPSAIHRLDELPRSTSDKTDLLALRALAETRAHELFDRRELTPTESTVAALFEKILDVGRVRPDRSIFELGGNSVSAVRLVSELEAIVERRVSLSTLLDIGSVEQLAAAIDGHKLGGQAETLVTIVEADFGLPVYCVAGADGHAVNLRPLGEAIGRPFHALEFAGTDGITPPDSSIEEMAIRFVAAIRHHRGNDEPVVLGGYSGGGFVALEMAQRLVKAGTPVALLFLIDSINPQLERRSVSRKVFDGLRELSAPDDMSPVSVLRNRLAADRLSRADNLFSAARRGRVPNVVDLTPDFERTVQAWEPPTYDGTTLIIRSAAVVPAYRGWERVITGPLDAMSVDSGHVRMMLPPDVDDLAAGLRDAIEHAERPFLRDR